jgi:hypothetical protein
MDYSISAAGLLILGLVLNPLMRDRLIRLASAFRGHLLARRFEPAAMTRRSIPLPFVLEIFRQRLVCGPMPGVAEQGLVQPVQPQPFLTNAQQQDADFGRRIRVLRRL